MKYYSLKKIKRNQKYTQKRGARTLYGIPRNIPVQNGVIEALFYQHDTLSQDYVVVEVHGGGFMYNTARDDDNFCAYIHKCLGIPVVSCDYRCSPQYQYPVGLQDVSACVEYVRREWNLSPQHIIIWGHSAGANLAAGVSFLDKADISPSIGLQILDYPYMDTYQKSGERQHILHSVSGKLMDTFAHYYTSSANLRNPMVSPALMQKSDLAGMPETYLLLCGRDNLNQGGKIYGKLLKEAGTKVTFCYEKEALHGFIENHFNYSYVPLMTKLQNPSIQRKLAIEHINRICAWVQTHLATFL